MGHAKCRKCEGAGCPACLGMGIAVKTHVKAWGKLEHKISNLIPEKVNDLPVADQRKCRAYVMEQLTYDA